MQVLCSCVPAFAYYLPMVGVARALQDAGHDVTFVTGAGFDLPAVDGFSLRVAGEDTIAPAMRAIGAAPQFSTLSPAEQRAFIVGRVFAGERLVTGFDDQLAAARDLDPDVLVHDPMDFAAPLIAALLGRANVSVGYGLAFRPELQAAAAGAVADRWRHHGLDVPADAGMYGDLYLDPCPPSLTDPAVPSRRCGSPCDHRSRTATTTLCRNGSCVSGTDPWSTRRWAPCLATPGSSRWRR